MTRTRLEEAVEKMIILKEITSPSGSLSDRAKREYEKVGKEVCERLKAWQALPEGCELNASLAWSDRASAWARKISLGIQEFKQECPEYWQKLNEIIEKHKNVRRLQIKFGVKDEHFPEEIYIKIIQECAGIDYERARKLYEALVMNDPLEKRTGSYEFLVPE